MTRESGVKEKQQREEAEEEAPAASSLCQGDK